MLSRLADELSTVFAFLSLAELLSARACSRALHATLDPRRGRARRAWRAAQPVADWTFITIPTATGAQLWWSAFPESAAPDAAFRVACGHGWLAKAQWLDATFPLTVRWPGDGVCGPFVDACTYGQLPVAQWIAGRHGITRRDVETPMRRACENGHLDVAQWLVATFDLTTDDVRVANDWILRYACKNGQLHVVQWVLGHFAIVVAPATLTEMLRGALNANHTAVANWIVYQFNEDIVYSFQAYTPQERRFVARFYEDLEVPGAGHNGGCYSC